jgi:hypothetical protein
MQSGGEIVEEQECEGGNEVCCMVPEEDAEEGANPF